MLQKAELSCEADSENYLGGSSETMYYIGLDVHKRTISYCVKDAAGRVHMEGKVGATRRELDAWIKMLSQPRTIAMEATIFTGWIYDHLLPHAVEVKVAHPLMLRAIAAAKRKNDRIDASKIADCLRCDFLPECHMASTEIRDRRRILRYRGLLVKQMVQRENRVFQIHHASRSHTLYIGVTSDSTNVCFSTNGKSTTASRQSTTAIDSCGSKDTMMLRGRSTARRN